MPELVVSNTDLITVQPTPAGTEELDLVVGLHGVPRITGNYLIYNGRITLESPTGETMIVAAPFRHEGQIYVHLSFGTENRKVGHTLTRDDFRKVVANLRTMAALADLEAGE